MLNKTPLEAKELSSHHYQQLKVAIERYQNAYSQLLDSQQQEVQRICGRVLALQKRILSSSEAALVYISPQQITDAIQQITKRFESTEAFEQALLDNQLEREGLAEALRQELICETTLDYVCRNVPTVDEQDAELYYLNNLDKFTQPARAKAAHVLITINDDFAENTAKQARKRIKELAAQATAENFGKLALRHSECPTAMEQGQLGWVEQGKLYPELDQALFAMEQGDISPVMQTEIGYHLLHCIEQMPAHVVSFAQAKPQLMEKLQAVKVKKAQKQWLASLAPFEQSALS